jgi:hypothetical protein
MAEIIPRYPWIRDRELHQRDPLASLVGAVRTHCIRSGELALVPLHITSQTSNLSIVAAKGWGSSKLRPGYTRETPSTIPGAKKVIAGWEDQIGVIGDHRLVYQVSNTKTLKGEVTRYPHLIPLYGHVGMADLYGFLALSLSTTKKSKQCQLAGIDLSYGLWREDAMNSGIMTNALQALLDTLPVMIRDESSGRCSLSHVTAQVSELNRASITVLNKSGFVCVAENSPPQSFSAMGGVSLTYRREII